MKKSLLALVVLVMTLVSCEGPEGPPGLDGEGVYWNIQNFTVRANEWKLYDDGDGPYFMCEKNYNALTDRVYTDGNVFAYRYIRPGQANEVQSPLPFTLHLEGGEYMWTETTYFDFMPGSIAFYVQYSDFFVEDGPGTIEFRVVLNW